MTSLSVLFSFGIAAFVGYLGQRLGWLTRSGGTAAAFVGGSIFAFTGWQGATILMLFFVSSSLLTRINRNRRGSPKDGTRRKAGPDGAESVARMSVQEGKSRNVRQVLANGLVASIAAVWAGLVAAAWEPGILGSVALSGPIAGIASLAGSVSTDLIAPRLALAGSLAAATADTWATEIGTWAGGVPRSALTARIVAPGESGGMTVFGTFGGLVGAALMGTAAAWVWDDFGVSHALAIEVAGFAGMWLDSLLGASVQYHGYCSTCHASVEDPGHSRLYDHSVERRRGVRFIDNDVVNLLATLAGAGIALIVGGA